MDAAALENDSFVFAKSAIEFDQKKLYQEAVFYYKEAAEALRQATIAGSKKDCLGKANEYLERCEVLESFIEKNKQEDESHNNNINLINMGEQRAKFLVTQALDEDAAGNKEEALELYAQGAELCIEIINKPRMEKNLTRRLDLLAKQALGRAEDIKEEKISKQLNALPTPGKTELIPTKPPSTTSRLSPTVPRKNLGNDYNANNAKRPKSPSPHTVKPVVPSSSNDGYTPEEIAVLRSSSSVNKIEYLPFMSVDLKERFAFQLPFSDKHGLLELSTKQKKRLGKWIRPSDIMENPQMIMAISSLSIKQTVVSDCSFVASLAISAAYERKYNKKLITSIIYPQDKKGNPMYNPCGKFMVKLHVNGIPRKVIIDDMLPVDKYGELLCSYSSNKNELWVSLVEKAYLKVMGGYDFPGSNSNIDLYALTGWIPERRSLVDKNFDKIRCFDEVHSRFHKGHCLATISTGAMSESEADRAGLVPTHAYAVLDFQKVEGLLMLQLKNPWSHVSWKGRFSAGNDDRWTPKLRKALNYDNRKAQLHDNGVFWIDFDSALHFFDTLYISWNPELFPHTTCIHAQWNANSGPRKDSYSVTNNPQYILTVKNSAKSAVWILLSRHITEKDDFAVNKEYIALVVYKNKGKKMYYAHDPPPYIDGVRINSPHCLTRIQVPATTTGSNQYTLVVSQWEKLKNISYTLRVYSTEPSFTFNKVPDPYKFKQTFQGEWTIESAGGCENHRDSYQKNPYYEINLTQTLNSHVLVVEMRAKREYSVGFDIECVKPNQENNTFKKESSGSFRSGYCMKEFTLPPGIYKLTLCTFLPGQIGPFLLDISCTFERTKITRRK